MTLPGNLPANYTTGQQFTAAAENTVETTINQDTAAIAAIIGGSSKLVNIGDLGFGSSAGTAGAASTAGTSEMMFKVGVGATDISALFNHWYTDMSNSANRNDTDPSGPITFSASLKVISSTNLGTVAGTIYRLTFGARTTVTLDPGGRIASDILGVSLAAGDVVAVRTYLSSGTAYAPRQTFGAVAGASGGFTTTTDLTAPGSAAITGSTGFYYGPSALLGYADSGAAAKSVLVIGDSIGGGGVDSGIQYTAPALLPGGFLIRALSGVAGLLNASIGGDLITFFQGTNGSFRRLSNATRANSAIIQDGTNDFANSVSAAVGEAAMLAIASEVRRMGISKVFVLTVVPRTTSTDNWATTANQTPLSTDSQRIAYNTWVRANCPVDPTTKAPVAVGTSGALLAGSFGHPITGIFDVAATVESSLNSGVWAAANRVATGSITSGLNTITVAGTTFTSTNQESGGDKGQFAFLAGAGPAGAALGATLGVFVSSTQYAINAVASATVTNTTLVIGTMTVDGVHPSSRGCYLMSQAVNTALL